MTTHAITHESISTKWVLGCCGKDELQVAPIGNDGKVVQSQARQKKIQYPIDPDETKNFTHQEILEIGALALCCSSLRKKYTPQMNFIAWCIASQETCPPANVAVDMIQQLLKVWYTDCINTPSCVPPATIDMLNDAHLQKVLNTR